MALRYLTSEHDSNPHEGTMHTAHVLFSGRVSSMGSRECLLQKSERRRWRYFCREMDAAKPPMRMTCCISELACGDMSWWTVGTNMDRDPLFQRCIELLFHDSCDSLKAFQEDFLDLFSVFLLV